VYPDGSSLRPSLTSAPAAASFDLKIPSYFVLSSLYIV
jgi:hypothetical protein